MDVPSPREAEFVRKKAKRKVSAKRRYLFGFLALIFNTEKLPFPVLAGWKG